MRWQCYAQAFSRKTFVDMLEYDDYSYFNWLALQFDHKILSANKTYLDYLSYIYKILVKNYRNEYVYKNELINQWLLKKYGTKNTSYFNEYKVGGSIVDLAMFNGESKAFEIKSDLDTPSRLSKQMQDYMRTFDKCYIVIPKSKLYEYKQYIRSNVGIILLVEENGKISLYEERQAKQNSEFDKALFMQTMRTEEYCSIICGATGFIPALSRLDWYQECLRLFLDIPDEVVKCEFLKLVKKRNIQTRFLRQYPVPIRQMLLSLNLSTKKRIQLETKLNTPMMSYVLPTITC